MKVKYDKETDILYINLNEDKIEEFDEKKKDLFYIILKM